MGEPFDLRPCYGRAFALYKARQAVAEARKWSGSGAWLAEQSDRRSMTAMYLKSAAAWRRIAMEAANDQ